MLGTIKTEERIFVQKLSIYELKSGLAFFDTYI